MSNITEALIADLALWDQAKRELEVYKAREAELRARIAGYFPHEATTEYMPLYNGWRVKGELKTNYSIIKEVLPDTLVELTNQGPTGAVISERLFRYKPELVVGEYNKLAPDYKRLADVAIKSSPATPVIEIVAPKEK